MIKPIDEFVNVTPVSPEYPNGAYRNDTVTGDKTGTPLDAVTFNDMQGFSDALLAEAGIVPSGEPDTATSSQRLEAIKVMMNERLGNPESKTPYDKLYAQSLPLGNIPFPVEFNNPLECSLYWDGQKVSYDVKPYDILDFEQYTIVNEYFVNYSEGNNANLGTSSGTGNSWKTLDYAVDNAVSPAVITLEDNLVGYLSSSAAVKTFSGKLKIKGKGTKGRTIIAAMRESYDKASFAWTQTGASNAYKSNTLSAKNYRSMFDNNYLNEKGVPRPMLAASNFAECENTAGTFYWDSGTSTLYVHMYDGREPDPVDGWIYTESPFDFEIQQSGNSSNDVLLIENCMFVSNNGNTISGAAFRYRPVSSGSTTSARIGLRNVLALGHSSNGIEIYDASIIATDNCHAWYNHADGLNYHSFVTTGTRGEYITVYEHDCTAMNNGWDKWADQTVLGTSSNGSTAHDSMHIVRTNTVAAMCNGAVIADVNGCLSFNCNVLAGKPNTGGSASPKTMFWHEKYQGAGLNKRMYLWGCSAHTDNETGVSLTNTIEQAGGDVNKGEIRVKYWRGQTDIDAVGSIFDFDGNEIV